MANRRQKFNKTIRFVPVLDNGDLDLVAYQNMVNENTCLVAFTMCSNTPRYSQPHY